MKNHKYFFVALGLGILLILFSTTLNFTFAQTEGESDAIAVRIMPNPNHYSVTSWYEKQGFIGAPQALIVDGYNAIRNGRSVYISASNVLDVDGNNMLSENDVLYTNIYLISYNQDVKNNIVDIFGQLLKNWKFNTSITQPGRCKNNPSTVCHFDDECSDGDYCRGSRAVIIRDVQRLVDLADLNLALEKYQEAHSGLCPKLSAGTYLPHISISTWPSWQKTLANVLGIPLPVDPINKLGPCRDSEEENKLYNEITCWDEIGRDFSVPRDPFFNLPAESLAYSYVASADGQSCSFYAPTEAGLDCGDNGACIVRNTLFDATNGYCGDRSVQIDLREQCDDGNFNEDDACSNKCTWTIKQLDPVTFSGGGTADALVYDDNELPGSISNTNGTFLKLDKMLDTPYAWFADTNNNLISQVRTYVKCYPYGDENHPDDNRNLDPSSGGKTGYICPKKLPDGWDYSFDNHQHPGQIIEDFTIVGKPSRTAVNVETNEVWIAARSGAVWGTPGKVEKLQMHVNGDYFVVAEIPNSAFKGLVRGLTIQRNGDIWAADCTGNTNTASIMRFSSSDLSLNKTIGSDRSFGCPYGLAIDSEDSIWMNDMGYGGMKKINPETGQISTYSNAQIYGIALDLEDNAWGGGYNGGYGIKKIPYGQASGPVVHFKNFTNWNTYMTGVTLDKDGNIWSGGYYPQFKTYKFNVEGELQSGFPVVSGGTHPHGIFGTSDGYVWQSHISSNIVRVFNANGGVVADFKGGNIASGIYTYSDATGLNRAMIMRSGFWVSNPIDSGFADQHWGTIFWEENLDSTKQTIEVYARADNQEENLKNRPWLRVYREGDPGNKGNTWNSLSKFDPNRAGRYVQFKVLLRSTERGVTPVLWNLQIQ